MKMDFEPVTQEWIDSHCIYPDFPKKGIRFVDIFPLLAERFPADFEAAFPPADKVVFTPEARGFLFYQALGPEKVVPLRKAGKLPGQLVEIRYEKEYGSDRLFFQLDALKRALRHTMATQEWTEEVEVMVFDDVLATGGTVGAIIDCLHQLQLEGLPHLRVAECRFYLEIEALGGRPALEHKGVSVQSVYRY